MLQCIQCPSTCTEEDLMLARENAVKVAPHMTSNEILILGGKSLPMYVLLREIKEVPTLTSPDSQVAETANSESPRKSNVYKSRTFICVY